MHVCPHPRCGLSPLIHLGDGQALGFQKSMASCDPLAPPNQEDPVIMGSVFADRLLIPNPKARKVIAAFSSRSACWQIEGEGVAPRNVPEDFKRKVDKAIKAEQQASCMVILILLF
jgi:hypothetical protein